MVTIPAQSPVTTIGDNVASASVTAAGSADLVSAATNTGGIIITSLSLSLESRSDTASTLDLIVNSIAVMRVTARGNTSAAPGTPAVGGFCAVKIPAGQAVGYTLALGGGTGSGTAYITWKAA